MLTVHQLHVAGRHHTLLPATTAEAQRAQVLLIQADGQERRTALALTLTGRMKPTTGSVTLGHDPTMPSLRRRSALVDAPSVNAPEHHLTVRSLTSEDLALVPYKFRDRTRPTEWLVKHGFRDILDDWIEALEPERLLHLQLELALSNHDVELLVVDSPDRHTADVSAWLPLLKSAAAGELGLGPDRNAATPLRPLLVIGVVGRIPDEWDGPAVVVGNDVPDAAGADAAVADAAVTDAVQALQPQILGLQTDDDEQPPATAAGTTTDPRTEPTQIPAPGNPDPDPGPAPDAPTGLIPEAPATADGEVSGVVHQQPTTTPFPFPGDPAFPESPAHPAEQAIEEPSLKDKP